MSKYLIKNVRIVNPDSVFNGDILIKNEIIEDICNSISSADAIVVDGKGKYAFPGFIDFHVHLQDQIGAYSIADSFSTGTQVALKWGITTIGSFVTQTSSETIVEALSNANTKVDNQLYTDLQWKLTPITFDKSSMKDISKLIVDGYRIFKFYTTYKEQGIFTDYVQILDFAKATSNQEITIMVHAQDDSILESHKFPLVSDIDSQYSLKSEVIAVNAIRKQELIFILHMCQMQKVLFQETISHMKFVLNIWRSQVKYSRKKMEHSIIALLILDVMKIANCLRNLFLMNRLTCL